MSFCFQGNARIVTLHFLLSLIVDDEIDLQTLLPKVWESMRSIVCRNVGFANKEEQVFDNFKLSGRGAIRRAPNVISWMHFLLNQKQVSETDIGGIIQRWNKKSARSMHLVGNKAQTLRNILQNTSDATQDILMNHVSMYDWDGCCLAEDALASKRLWPGTIFRVVSSKKWTERGRVTKDSCHLMFEHAFNEFESLVPCARKKFNKKDLEEFSEKAAVVLSIRAEALAAGIPKDVVDEGFTSKFKCGDPRVCMDISSAMQDKREDFVLRDMTCLKDPIKEGEQN